MNYSINPNDYKHLWLRCCIRNGVQINLDNPTTIQDKLMWLNVHEQNPMKSFCADKIKVHDYCKKIIGKDICVPIINVWDKVKDIDWNSLPDKFAIKCNHGSGMNIIVKNKKELNVEAASAKLDKWIKKDFTFQNGFEAHYHDIERKIFAEKYMNDGNETLYDYKFWCFNGNPEFYTINDGNGHGKWMLFYDMKQNQLPYKRRDFAGTPQEKIAKPPQFNIMKDYAEKLSKEFTFVRVDFYEIDGQVYLGEMTFTPGACAFTYLNKEDNAKIGSLLHIKTDDVKPNTSKKKIEIPATKKEIIIPKNRRVKIKNIHIL